MTGVGRPGLAGVSLFGVTSAVVGFAGAQALCGGTAGQGLSEDFQVRSEISSIFTGLYIQIKPLKHGLNLVYQGKRGVR